MNVVEYYCTIRNEEYGRFRETGEHEVIQGKEVKIQENEIHDDYDNANKNNTKMLLDSD